MALVTISRNIGTGGENIAKAVADELKLELYDDTRLEQEAIQLGLRPDELKALDERAPGLFSRILSSKPQVYMDLIQTVVYGVAKGGHGVIVGHGSQVLLRDFGCALHVRVFASEPYRIQYLMNQKALSHEAAKKLIQKTDHEQEGFLQFAFHMNWNDPSLYDLVINCDKLSAHMASRLIIEAAHSQEIKECSLTALDSMDRLSLLRRVEAALLEKKETRDIFNPDTVHIEVPEKGVVHISGYTNTKGAERLFRRVIEGIRGVTEIHSDLGYIAPTIV